MKCFSMKHNQYIYVSSALKGANEASSHAKKVHIGPAKRLLSRKNQKRKSAINALFQREVRKHKILIINFTFLSNL